LRKELQDKRNNSKKIKALRAARSSPAREKKNNPSLLGEVKKKKGPRCPLGEFGSMDQGGAIIVGRDKEDRGC